MSNASYTKLKDDTWGIRCVGFVPDAGVSVTVTKRDGSTKREFVARVVWSGKDKGQDVALCSLQTAERNPLGQYEGNGSGWVGRKGSGKIEREYRSRYGWDGVRGSASYYSSGMYDEES